MQEGIIWYDGKYFIAGSTNDYKRLVHFGVNVSLVNVFHLTTMQEAFQIADGLNKSNVMEAIDDLLY